MTKTVTLDKYARDARAWRDFANLDYAASTYLFESRNPFLLFSAATLGHHALEMYLKAALICEGCTVFDPKKFKYLSPPKGISLKKPDCVWGHNLVSLAQRLAKKRSDFKLTDRVTFLLPVHHSGVPTMQKAFEIFEPFFSELRYPQELSKLRGVGEDDKLLLDELVGRLQPFLAKIK